MPAFSSRHTTQFIDAGGASVTGAAALTATSTLTVAGVRTRFAAAALTGTSSMTVAGTVLRVGAAALTGTSTLTVDGVNSAFGSCTLTGVSSLTCTALTPPPDQPETGGFVRVKPRLPLLPTTKLTPAAARVCIYTFPPRLKIVVAAERTSTIASAKTPVPTLFITATASSNQRLGELPDSKREILDLILVADL